MNNKFELILMGLLFYFSLSLLTVCQALNDHDNLLVLFGDIGGTNARLQLSQLKNGERQMLAKKNYKLSDYENVDDIVKFFLSEFHYDDIPIESACIAAAIPSIGGEARLTNTGQIIDIEQLKFYLKTNKIKLIEDFEAIGYGVRNIDKEELDLYVLQEGSPETSGLKVIIGAGTGLGVSFMYWDGSQYIVHPSEGGHVNFAPYDDAQIDVFKYLREKYGRVSIERLLSGQGLVDIYYYFYGINLHGDHEVNNLVSLLEDSKEKSPVIVKYAHNDANAMQALRMFVEIYGAKTGDIAYTFLPQGGLYIAGGIAPAILDHMTKNKIFINAFKNKGRLSSLLKKIPIYVIRNSNVGLLGAEYCAFDLI